MRQCLDKLSLSYYVPMVTTKLSSCFCALISHSVMVLLWLFSSLSLNIPIPIPIPKEFKDFYLSVRWSLHARPQNTSVTLPMDLLGAMFRSCESAHKPSSLHPLPKSAKEYTIKQWINHIYWVSELLTCFWDKRWEWIDLLNNYICRSVMNGEWR